MSNRTGLAPGKGPDQVEQALYKVVPDKYLKEAHHLLLLHGRYTCKARTPDCKGCVIIKFCKFNWRKINMSVYNNKKNLFFKLKQDAPKEWEQYTKHKFIIGLGNGTLKLSSFKDYLLQDYIFLQKFIKILSLSAYKAKNSEDRDVIN